MLPPHETVPPLPPVTLNVVPVAPVSDPPVVPHVPVMALRFTPFASPVELTSANVPLIWPVVRFRALAAVTLTDEPMNSAPKFVVLAMPTVAPLPPLMVTLASVRLVDTPCKEMPVVPAPLVIVPPLTATPPCTLVRAMPVVAPVVFTLAKAHTTLGVMPLILIPAGAAPVVTVVLLATCRMPPPVALKPVPVVVVMARTPA